MATKRTTSAAGSKIPEHHLAQAVATYQVFGGRNSVAARFHIGRRSLTAAVARLKTDSKFAGLVAEKQEELEVRSEEWVDDAVDFMRSGLGKLRRLIDKAEPAQIRAVAGALKVVGEILTVRQALGKPGVSPEPTVGGGTRRRGQPNAGGSANDGVPVDDRPN